MNIRQAIIYYKIIRDIIKKIKKYWEDEDKLDEGKKDDKSEDARKARKGV